MIKLYILLGNGYVIISNHGYHTILSVDTPQELAAEAVGRAYVCAGARMVRAGNQPLQQSGRNPQRTEGMASHRLPGRLRDEPQRAARQDFPGHPHSLS